MHKQKDSHIRIISAIYLELQSGTEFLTKVKRFNPYINSKHIPLHTPVHKTHSDVKSAPNQFQLQSLCRVMVELSYLLYTCWLKNIRVYVSKYLFIRPIKNSFNDVYALYYLSDDPQIIKFNLVADKMHEKPIQRIEQLLKIKHYFVQFDLRKHDSAFANLLLERILCPLLDVGVEYAKRSGVKSEAYQQIKCLAVIIKKHLKSIILEIPQPSFIIRCLEQSSLFIENSSILTIMNSIINFKIIDKPDNHKLLIHIFGLSKKYLEKTLFKRYSLDSQMQNVIRLQKFLIALIKFGIVQADRSISIDKLDKQDLPQLFNLGSYNQKTALYTNSLMILRKTYNNFSVNTIVQILTKFDSQSAKKLIERKQVEVSDPQENKQAQKIQIEVLFNKNSQYLTLKIKSSIVLNIENSDFFIYQYNNFASQCQGFSIQLEQVTRKDGLNPNPGEKRDRLICFKIVLSLNFNDKPFLNILIHIDKLLIVYLTIQPEMKKGMNSQRNIHDISEALAKLEHFQKLVMPGIHEFYNNIDISELVRYSQSEFQ